MFPLLALAALAFFAMGGSKKPSEPSKPAGSSGGMPWAFPMPPGFVCSWDASMSPEKAASVASQVGLAAGQPERLEQIAAALENEGFPSTAACVRAFALAGGAVQTSAGYQAVNVRPNPAAFQAYRPGARRSR